MDLVSDARQIVRKSTIGVTLIELLVVLVLVGITAKFAVGSWQKVQAKIQARASMETLLVALHRARSDATTKERRSGVAISNDSSSSFVTNGASRSGLRYLRFVDATTTGTVGSFDDQDSVIQDWQTLDGKAFAYSMSSSGLSNGVASIVFSFDGSTDNDLRMNLGMANFTDTFHLLLLPATGLARLER